MQTQVVYTTTTAVPTQTVVVHQASPDSGDKTFAFVHLVCAIIPIPLLWIVGSICLIFYGMKSTKMLCTILGIVSLIPVIGYWGPLIWLWYVGMIIFGILNICL